MFLATFLAAFSSFLCLSLATPCPPCGNLSVPYPLSTAASCGHPDYPVFCSSQTSQLQLKTVSGSYQILNVTSSSRTLIIAPPALKSSSCISQDVSAGGLILNQSQPFSVTPANSIVFFNCTQLLLQSPLNCSSNSPCQQAIATESNACQGLLCCFIPTASPSNAYVIPANESTCSAYSSVVGFNAAESAKDWSYGVELKWTSPAEPPCTNQSQCESNSNCSGLKCLCNSGYTWDSFSGVCTKVPSKRNTALIAALTSTLGVALVAALLLAYIYRRRQAIKRAQEKLSKERSKILTANGAKAARIFSSKDMQKATNGFAKDRFLGSGAFGEVYKGIIDDGTVVAIKVAKVGNVKGNDQVLNEVRILSQVNHRSLVRLLGCCVETEQPLMVYEYVQNGTLFEHLNRSKGKVLDWKTRLSVAFQTAEGLAYLHSSAYPPIIHRDVKSSNILLDTTLSARVSDFGLSRLAEPDLTHVTTCAQGTLGYLDPEYYRNYQLTDKSDVYSFGVVLLELVTAQRAIDFSREQDDVNLAIYVQARVDDGKTIEVFDPCLVETASEAMVNSMKAVTLVALDCLRESRADRPSMKEVMEELQYIMNLEAATEAE